MTNFLNRKFEKLGINNFLKVAPLLTWICDCILAYYASQILLPLLLTNDLLIQSLIKNGVSIDQISLSDMNEMRELLLSMFQRVFYAALIYHGVINIFFHRKKAWAVKYIRFYCFSTAILSIGDIAAPFISRIPFSPFTTITVFGYIIVLLGILYFQKKKEL